MIEARWDAALHPRDRVGRFRDVIAMLAPGDILRLPKGVLIQSQGNGRYTLSEPRWGVRERRTVKGVGGAVNAVRAALRYPYVPTTGPGRLGKVETLGVLNRPGINRPHEFHGLVTG